MTDDLNQSLHDLVEQAIERLQRGESVDIDELAAQRPELRERLASLAPMLQMLAGLSESSRRSSLAGRKLGEFELVREIGRGGMGIVWEARQDALGRRVAVKLLPHASLLDERAQKRFATEVRVAAALRHPHIVPVYAVGCDQGLHYYAMQLIDGLPLSEVIRQRRGGDVGTAADVLSTQDSGPHAPREESGATDRSPNLSPSPQYSGERAGVRGGSSNHDQPLTLTLSPEYRGEGTDRFADAKGSLSSRGARGSQGDWFRRVAEIGRQVALGLHHAHQNGIVHRDIKPANLLLDGEQNAWIADFGLAQFDEGEAVTVTGDLIGTLRYMSPEQALEGKDQVDHRTDIYSLGASLWEAVALRPLIDATTRAGTLQALQSSARPALRRIQRDVPRDLEWVLLKALAKNPADRYATAAELAEDVERFLKGKRVIAGGRKLSRRSVMLGAVGAAGATAIIPIIGDFFRGKQAQAVEGGITYWSLGSQGLSGADVYQRGSQPFVEYYMDDLGDWDKDKMVDCPYMSSTQSPRPNLLWRLEPMGDYVRIMPKSTERFMPRAAPAALRLDRRMNALLYTNEIAMDDDQLWKVVRAGDRVMFVLKGKGGALDAGDCGWDDIMLSDTVDPANPSQLWKLEPRDGGCWQLSVELPKRSVQTIEIVSTHGAQLEPSPDQNVHANHGVRGSPPVYTVVKFDVSSLQGRRIERAAVRVEWRDAGVMTPVAVSALRGNDWQETNVTWSSINNGDDPLSATEGVLRAHASPKARGQKGIFTEWQITDLVRDWTSGRVSNRGLIFSAPDTDRWVTFWSRHELDGTHGPKLVVEVLE